MVLFLPHESLVEDNCYINSADPTGTYRYCRRVEVSVCISLQINPSLPIGATVCKTKNTHIRHSRVASSAAYSPKPEHPPHDFGVPNDWAESPQTSELARSMVTVLRPAFTLATHDRSVAVPDAQFPEIAHCPKFPLIQVTA